MAPCCCQTLSDWAPAAIGVGIFLGLLTIAYLICMFFWTKRAMREAAYLDVGPPRARPASAIQPAQDSAPPSYEETFVPKPGREGVSPGTEEAQKP